jgi:hypothetical protein
LDGVTVSVSPGLIFWDGGKANDRFEALLTLFPPTDCCENPRCDRTTELKREDARQVVVYTINGVQPAYSIHLTCHSMHIMSGSVKNSLTCT